MSHNKYYPVSVLVAHTIAHASDAITLQVHAGANLEAVHPHSSTREIADLEAFLKCTRTGIGEKLNEALSTTIYTIGAELGFGRWTGSEYSSTETTGVINSVLEENERTLTQRAQEQGHEVQGHIRFSAINDPRRPGGNTTVMTITPLRIILNSGQVITIASPERATLRDIGTTAFGTNENIATAIVRYISPDFSAIMRDWNTMTNPPANTRSALTLGTSVTYSHSFYTDTHAKYGLYTGVEAFAEFTPTKMKSHRFMIKEAEIGFRPCIGIEARENWRFYAIFGIKASKKSVKFAALSKRITKPAFEIGLGTEYIISQRYTAGFKIIKTLRQQHKLMTIPFSSTSLKILFSFGVRF